MTCSICKNAHKGQIPNYLCQCFCHIRSGNTTEGNWFIKGNNNTGEI